MDGTFVNARKLNLSTHRPSKLLVGEVLVEIIVAQGNGEEKTMSQTWQNQTHWTTNKNNAAMGQIS
jgi:hypothetical protein